MASVMGICGGMVGPKSRNVEKVLVLKALFKGQTGHDYSREKLQASGRSGFGIILGSLWGHFGVILESLGSF